MFKPLVLIACTALSASALAQANDPAEVDAVTAAVKSANPDFKALCKQGPDGIRKATTDAVMGLVGAGKIKGNPHALGGEAGQKLGRECRGG